jgi:hypothetical protein
MIPSRSAAFKTLQIICFSFLVGVLTASGQQCTAKLSELPPATELLGFHLGMTKDEVKARVPQAVFGKTDPFGVAKTTINPYFDSKIDKTKFESVRSVSLDLLDDRLISIWVGFDETYKIQLLDEFTKSVSRSLRVPENWTSWKSRGQQLRCADFQMIVTMVAGGPTLRLLDLAADDTVAARRLAKEEADSGVVESRGDGAQTSEILADRQQKIFYINGCHPAKDIPEANRVTFKSKQEAEKAGFKLAENCHQ